MTISKKILTVLTIVIILIIAGGSTVFASKAIQAKKISIGNITVEFPNGFNFLKIVMGGLKITVKIILSNYSNANITVNQIKIDVFSLENNLIVSQIAPLSENIEVLKNSNTPISIDYLIDYTSLVTLLKDNKMITSLTDATTIIKNIVTSKKLGTQIILKGFVTAEKVKVNINETIDV